MKVENKIKNKNIDKLWHYNKYNNANNPTAQSYLNKPLAKHYREKHPNNSTPVLSVKVLEKGDNTVNRKIREARIIAKNNPTIASGGGRYFSKWHVCSIFE